MIVAYRGKIKLAAEIALASAAQVAVFLIPAVALLSWLIDPIALASALSRSRRSPARSSPWRSLWGGHSTRLRGVMLIAAYVVVATVFYVGRRPLTLGVRTSNGSRWQRVGREGQLLDCAVVVTDARSSSPRSRPSTHRQRSSPSRLEERDLPTRHTADELGLEPALPHENDDLVALRPPASEQPLELGGRRLARAPRSARRRQRVERGLARSSASASG